MKKFITLSFLFFSLVCFAQQKDLYSFRISPQKSGVEIFQGVTFYYVDGSVYNCNSFLMSETGPIIDMKINPSYSSYALLHYDSNQKQKKLVEVYSISEAETRVSAVKKLKAEPTAICYTPNARNLLVSTKDQNLFTLDALKCIPYDTLKINTIAEKLVMSDNGLILSVVHAKTVDIWNWRDKKLRKTIRNQGKVRQVSFSENSELMAILTDDGLLKVYNTSDFSVKSSVDALGDAVSCSFHPEGKYVAVITGDNRIVVANILNTKKRYFIEAQDNGVNFLKFTKTSTSPCIFLGYNTNSNVYYKRMDELSPLYSRLISEKLQERMDEWAKQRPGETLEEYTLRVNETTRQGQVRLLEREITNDIALSEMGLTELGEVGSYNTDSHMLSIAMNNDLPNIYINVPEEEISSFMKMENIQLQNVRYALNNEDELVMAFAEVYNKETGKVYTYNNEDGQFLDFMSDEANITPFELLQQSKLEEKTLEFLSEKIVSEAKDKNLITDHTNISVKTAVRNATNAEGKKIHNYEVGITYEVDEEFSARDDYAAGKYKIEETNAGMAMLQIVKKALGEEFAKYMVSGKHVAIKITGSADAKPVRRTIKYDGCYGNFEMEPIFKGESMSNISVSKASGINDNDQLAFLRAVGVKDYLMREVSKFSEMNTDVNYNILVSDKEGSQYRKVSILFSFEDAFDL